MTEVTCMKTLEANVQSLNSSVQTLNEQIATMAAAMQRQFECLRVTITSHKGKEMASTSAGDNINFSEEKDNADNQGQIFCPSSWSAVFSLISRGKVREEKSREKAKGVMGAPKQKWTSEEEDALRAGIDKHGAGKWQNIKRDPEFSQILACRSNIDLKDKWRNLSVSASGTGSREKLRGSKVKPAIAATPLSSYSGLPVSTVDDALKNGKVLRYSVMITEAISELQEPNGSEIGSICNFIEQKHEVPSNFRRLLSQKLRRLIHQNKIEKVQNCYRLKESAFATKTPTPKQKDPTSRATQNAADTVDEASRSAAYKIADAEAKAYLASEAIKEAEKALRMFEEADSLRILSEEILERCLRGEIVMLA